MWVWVDLYYLLISENEWKEDLTSCFSAAQTVILLSTSGQILQIFLRLIHPFDDPENARQMHRAAWTQCRGLQAQRGWPLKVSNWAKRKWRECVKLTLLTLWNSQSGIVSVFETPAAIAGTRLKGSGFEFNNLWWSHAPVTISHLPLLLPIYPDLTPLSTLRLQTTAFYSYHTWWFFLFSFKPWR